MAAGAGAGLMANIANGADLVIPQPKAVGIYFTVTMASSEHGTIDPDTRFAPAG